MMTIRGIWGWTTSSPGSRQSSRCRDVATGCTVGDAAEPMDAPGVYFEERPTALCQRSGSVQAIPPGALVYDAAAVPVTIGADWGITRVPSASGDG